MEEEIYVTLGCGDKFDPTKFEAPRNRDFFCKPWGGLWSSPVGSKWGWRDWVMSEMPQWMEERYGLSEFKFKFNRRARIYTIDSPYDLLKIPHKIKGTLMTACFGDLIDFEKMASYGFDAIYLTADGERTTRFSDYEYGMSLYGWDCECLLVLRPENIEVM